MILRVKCLLKFLIVNIIKVASAMLTHLPLIDLIVSENKHTFISTGMHSLDEIDEVVNKFVNGIVLLN